jgi:hypothetical protein
MPSITYSTLRLHHSVEQALPREEGGAVELVCEGLWLNQQEAGSRDSGGRSGGGYVRSRGLRF